MEGGLDAPDYIAASWWVSTYSRANPETNRDKVSSPTPESTPQLSPTMSGVYRVPERDDRPVEGIRPLVCRPEFQWPCEWILEVINCESSYRPGIVGSSVVNGIAYHFYGLLQIWHPDSPGPTNEYLFDPVLNIIEGHIQYVQWSRGERSNPWSNCP